MDSVLEVTTADFEQEVINSPLPVLADFWAPWCGPCRMVAPIVEEVAGDYQGRLKVVKVNVDENGELASRYGVMSIPSLLLFKEGRQVETLVGFHAKEDLTEKIDEIL